VNCGLSLLGELDQSGVRRTGADVTMLLHDASFLYGVAGTEDYTIPFLSSAELNYLSSLSDRFRSIGVRIAVTEQCLHSLGGAVNARYIGFVSSRDDAFIYKIYELLDACPDTERELLLQNEERFQKAIQLFYKNDFYLARNTFSAVLRACPMDGVARWYLFASEHYFNEQETEAGEDRRYNLFGVV